MKDSSKSLCRQKIYNSFLLYLRNNTGCIRLCNVANTRHNKTFFLRVFRDLHVSVSPCLSGSFLSKELVPLRSRRESRISSVRVPRSGEESSNCSLVN